MGTGPETDRSNKDNADTDSAPRQDAGDIDVEKQAGDGTQEQQEASVSVSGSATGSGSSTRGKEGKEGDHADLKKLDSHHVVQPKEEDLDSALAHLPEKERAILKEQLLIPDTKVSYFTLFRYASKYDIIILLVSSLCSIAAGAALPMFTVITSLPALSANVNFMANCVC